MDLSQEISLSSLFKKKDKAKDKGGYQQLKTYINFAEVAKEKTTNWALAIPGILAVVVAAVLFAWFGVIGRYNALSRAQSEASELQARLDEDMARLASSDEMSERYYHYTWSGMSDEEMDRISRVEAAQLVDFVTAHGTQVRSMTLKDRQMTMEITSDSLQTISALTRELEEQDVVSSCSMSTAQTREQEVEIGTPSQEAEEESQGTEGETSGDTSIKITVTDVDAVLNVYLKGISEVIADMEEAEK